MAKVQPPKTAVPARAGRDGDVEGLYRALGSAVSSWAAIDEALQQILSECMSVASRQPDGEPTFETAMASALLNSVEGLAARLGLIEAAICVALRRSDNGAVLLDAWVSESAKLAALQLKRSSLVSGTVVRELDEDGRLQSVRLGRSDKADEPAITQSELERDERRFLAAAHRLRQFRDRLASGRDLESKATLTGR